MSKQFLVVGSPIDHSKSPAIHRAAYKVLGLDWDYGRLEVAKNDLRQVLDNAPEALAGFSVTMPLKDEAARHANWRDEFAELSGSANTLVRAEAGWLAYNTDVFGIYKALAPIVSNPASVLVIGSGATAYSAIMAVKLMNSGVRVLVLARNAETRGGLIEFARKLGLKAKPARNLRSAVTRVDVTIATLPARALDDEVAALDAKGKLKPRGALLDVAYNPWPSAMATVWLKQQRPVVSGIDMLIWQAVAQLRIFVGGNPNEELPNEIAVLEAMRHAV